MNTRQINFEPLPACAGSGAPWWMNADGTVDKQKLAIEGERMRREMNERDFEQASALWAAGWTAETPHATQEDIMSYYWRRPGKRKGKKGRLFLSTNQAYNAMTRDSLQNDPSAGTGFAS